MRRKINNTLHFQKQARCYGRLATVLENRRDLSKYFEVHAINAQINGHGRLLKTLIKVDPKAFTQNNVDQFASIIPSIQRDGLSDTQSKCKTALWEILNVRPDLKRAGQYDNDGFICSF